MASSARSERGVRYTGLRPRTSEEVVNHMTDLTCSTGFLSPFTTFGHPAACQKRFANLPDVTRFSTVGDATVTFVFQLHFCFVNLSLLHNLSMRGVRRKEKPVLGGRRIHAVSHMG